MIVRVIFSSAVTKHIAWDNRHPPKLKCLGCIKELLPHPPNDVQPVARTQDVGANDIWIDTRKLQADQGVVHCKAACLLP